MSIPFLSTVIGMVCLTALIIVSLINIYAHWVEDGLFGRALHMATVVTCIAGLVKFADDLLPGTVGRTLIVLFTLTMLRNLVVKLMRHQKVKQRRYEQKDI